MWYSQQIYEDTNAIVQYKVLMKSPVKNSIYF